MNGQKLELTELEEINQLMDIRLKDKERKIATYD